MRTKLFNSKYALSVVAALLLMLPANAQTGTSESWTTTSSKRMEQQAVKALTNTNKASTLLTLNTEEVSQKIDGFGWMLNQGSAKLLMQLPADTRRALLEELYGRKGLNASIVRVAIGACDLSESDYTYADSKDETLSNFAIAQQDLTTVVPILQEIISINPDVKVLALPWTAPTWMKSGASWTNAYIGGTLKSEYYNLYADYFCKYIDAMAAWNIPVWGVSVQNEPLNGHNNPSMTWTKENMYKFVAGSLGPKLKEKGHGDVKIIAYDHNCDVTDFPIHVATSKYVYGTAFHLYAGDISALKTVYNSTGKPVLFTEQYTGKDGDFYGDFSWHIQNVVLGSVNNFATTVIEWNLCSDPNYSIHTAGGCTTCKGALTVNGSELTARNVAYYIVGHISRVVDPGARRIGISTSANSLKYAAFANPDGTYGVVLFSDTDSPRSADIAFKDANTGETMYAPCTIPSKGVTSVRITPASVTALDPNIQSSNPQIFKFVKDGQLLIERNGVLYDLTGTRVK